jgi:hypothetical protein
MRHLKRNLWPFKIKLDVVDSNLSIDAVELWLSETCGSFKSNWNAVYHANYTDFYFKNGEDAMLFKLQFGY